ncbi:hypothetical protein [Planctomyces sp. SH-PL14]|uniref:hypothetical protein n=1 Tax=Planctomyces sp. SH-PL14 TaxID=1632864 RepID=UPI00078C09F0|nr:hypothetical protein [Planctomyces sp. SH-PL14]AMV16259.1 hypothetical protein VT03_00110 [Planctomyces sp. SH-PL14]
MNRTFDPRTLPDHFAKALLPAIRLHQAYRLPMVVWENGSPVWKSPDEIEAALDASPSTASPSERK